MRRNLYFLVLALGLLFTSCISQLQRDAVYQNLNGRWEFRKLGDSIWQEATVPGTVHTDLYKNVLIDDPFFRDNESKLQWIDTLDWEYALTFTPDPALFFHDSVQLIFEGLDTFTEVFLNGNRILQTDNMFRIWSADVKALLEKGEENTLLIHFYSPTRTLEKIYERQPYSLPAANDRADKKLSVYARKAPYHFGWDWGPRFVTSGIWKPVSLRAWSNPEIRQIFYETLSLESEQANIQVSGLIESDRKQEANIIISDEQRDQVYFSGSIKLTTGSNHFKKQFTISQPEIWWPNDLGKPNLYTMKAEVRSHSGHSTVSTRIGLRTIELIRQPDKSGESFLFEVNGQPVFIKGANYIPQDNFTNHVMSTEYDHLIQSAKEAHMNMLRVWGGGIYELDYFYDLCDANGIMVWQDFMFACSMYPGDQKFLDNVGHEARDNIVRLRNHPSIALWCGNNEVQDAWFGWGWQRHYTAEQKREISQDYEALFNQLLPDVLQELDPGRPYWPSSPASGTEYGQRSNIQSGDYHYWGVWHQRLPFESYGEMIPRFSSEYGFQSFPDIKTVYSYTWPADRDIDSPIMRAHQKHPIGNQLILNYMERYYPIPEDFEGFIYMSQVMQGEGVRYGIESLRKAMPYCMGSLYWQLNDCWPVASWSGIDYFGRWKSLHYQAREAYNPLLLSFTQTQDSLALYLVSDERNPIAGQLHLSLVDFNGRILWETSKNTTAKPLTVNLVWKQDLAKILNLHSGMNEIFALSEFYPNQQDTIRRVHYFVQANKQRLSKPELKINWNHLDTNQTITVESNTLVRQLYLHYPGETEVRFDPNYFDLLPDHPVSVHIHKLSREPFNPDLIKSYCINQYVEKK